MTAARVSLTPCFRLGGTEYRVEWLPAAKAQDPDAGRASFRWVDAHRRSGRTSLALQRCGSSWWLITAEGRKRSILGGARRAYGTAAGFHIGELAAEAVAALLPALEQAPPDDTRQSAVEVQHTAGRATSGLLARLREWGSTDTAVFVCDAAEAAAILRAPVAAAQIRFLYLVAHSEAPQELGCGLGLALGPEGGAEASRADVPLDTALRQIDACFALRALTPDSRRRCELAALLDAAAEPRGRFAPLSLAEADWALAGGVAPQAVVAHCGVEVITAILAGERLDRSVLAAASAEALQQTPLEARLPAFERTAADARRYTQLFGPQGVAELIPAELEPVWQQWCEQLPGATDAAAAGHLCADPAAVRLAQLLTEAGAWGAVPLASLGWLRHAGLLPEDPWRMRLAQELPAAAALLGPGPAPPELPEPSAWLPGVPLERLAAAQPGTASSTLNLTRWRALWVRHPDSGGRAPEQMRERAELVLRWLGAAVEHRLLGQEQARAALLEQLQHGVGCLSRELIRDAVRSVWGPLQCAGSSLACLIEPGDAQPGAGASPALVLTGLKEHAALVAALAHAGLLDPQVIDALLDQPDPGALGLPLDPAALALLRDPDPPGALASLESLPGGVALARSPAGDLPPAVRHVLRHRARTDRFWSRWGGRLEPSLAGRIAQLEGSDLTRAVAAVYTDPAGRLEDATAQLVAGALPRAIVLRHVALCSASTSRSVLPRARAALGEALHRWLTDLIELKSLGPPPDLTPEDTLALLPILDVERDVLRPLLARLAGHEPTDSAFVAALIQGLEAPAGALAAPGQHRAALWRSAGAGLPAERRPEWDRLTRLLGWAADTCACQEGP